MPASMASSVDLPAPFGPISPVSVPRRTLNETPATARTPPNSRATSDGLEHDLAVPWRPTARRRDALTRPC